MDQQQYKVSSHKMTRYWVFAFGVVALAAYMFVLRPSSSTIEWRNDAEGAMSEAGERRTGLLIWFTTDSCVFCRMMNQSVFPDAGVTELVERYVPLRVDVNEQPGFSGRFGVDAIPAFYVVSTRGEVVSDASGFLKIDEFKSFLQNAGEKVWPSPSLVTSSSR